MKVLITGGTGYIGSHTAVEFQNEGHEVIIIDNLSNSDIKVLDGIEKITGKKPQFFKADLVNLAELNDVFTKVKNIDVVIHFAAFKAVGESVQFPMKYYTNNVTGMINLLDVMLKNNINNIVFSSSCTVYGESKDLPVTEESPIIPAKSPYGFTKQIGERLLEDTTATNDLNAISLRYFNPIGAHDTALIGELPLGVPNNLVPFITQTAIGLRKELTIFGNDYDTPDGTNIRDYIHVVDLAKAHVKAADRIASSGKKLEVFNLGTGVGNSVLEVVKLFEKVSDKNLNYKIGPRREGDVVAIYSDTRKATDVLGWKTERSLENALSTAWKWEQALQNQAKQ